MENKFPIKTMELSVHRAGDENAETGSSIGADTCTRVTAACRTHAYSRDAQVPHPRAYAGFTHARDAAAVAARCTIMRSREENAGERERERSIVQGSKRDGNNGDAEAREKEDEGDRERESERE